MMLAINRLKDWWQGFDDRLNPIVVRELRQSVRGRFTLIAFMLFLVVMLLTSALFVANNEASGPELAQIMFAILMVVCILLIPFMFGVRSALEREREQMDLLFVSTLSPNRIVGGKLIAASVVSLLFFSAAAPFLTLTYFLRGVDVLTILVVLLLLFALVVFMLQAAIFVGSMPTPLYMKILLGLGFIFCGFIVLGITTSLSQEILESGWGSFQHRFVSDGMFGLFLIFAGLTAGLFLLTAAFYKSPYHNPAFAPRIFFFGMCAFWLAAGHTWLGREAMGALVFLVLMIALGGFTVGICEEEEPHRHMLRTLPPSFLRRALLFPFYSGSASALIWSLLLAGFALTAYGIKTGGSYHQKFFEICLGLALYTYFYGLTAFSLRRRLWPGIVSRQWNWLLAVILTGFGMFIPWTIAVLLWSGDEMWEHSLVFVLNPFGLEQNNHRDFLLGTISLLTTLVAIFHVKRVLQAWRHFKRPAPEQAKASFPPPRRGRRP